MWDSENGEVYIVEFPLLKALCVFFVLSNESSVTASCCIE